VGVNRGRLVLTILLMAAYLLLMDPRAFYGLVFHEWAGLIISLFVVLHLGLDWKFVTAVTARFVGRLPGKTRLNYVLDVALLIGVLLVIWSGLPIARVIDFSWMGFERESMRFWRTLHTSASMIVLLLIGVHLGLHWRWVLARVGWR